MKCFLVIKIPIEMYECDFTKNGTIGQIQLPEFISDIDKMSVREFFAWVQDNNYVYVSFDENEDDTINYGGTSN